MKPRFLLFAWIYFLIYSLLLALPLSSQSIVKADNPSPTVQAGDPPTPIPTLLPGARFNRRVTLPYNAYVWQLIRWPNNVVDCVLIIEHEGNPSEAEITQNCTNQVLTIYKNSTVCPGWDNNGDLTDCKGEYFRRGATIPRVRIIQGNFAPPSTWIVLTGCNPVAGYRNQCASLPSLEIHGEEPIPTEKIWKIEGFLNGVPFRCNQNPCNLTLSETSPKGVRVDFWASSTLGDDSEHDFALVRIIPLNKVPGNLLESVIPEWVVDILSSQLHGPAPASCADIWYVFPDLSGPPDWLSRKNENISLVSTEPLALLAGMLIQTGNVDAKDCPSGGLLPTNAANTCGLEKAKDEVSLWQNQFNDEILQAAQTNDIPPYLIKNIFIQESQFWPGTYTNDLEAGLGQLTEGGADTLLMWNQDFYNGFCANIFSMEGCALGYARLGKEERRILRGALLKKVNASCINCKNGIDLEKARFSINVFAAGLRASCFQTGQVMFNVTKKLAGQSISYEDLWKFTLVDYNAGSGCLDTALRAVNTASKPLNWANVSNALEEACKGAIGYVENASQVTKK